MDVWLQRVRVETGTRKGCVGAAVTLLHVDLSNTFLLYLNQQELFLLFVDCHDAWGS